MSELQAISISKYLGYTLIHCDGNNQLEYAKYQKTRQCEICNCLLDKSLISQNCQSGLIGQNGPSGPIGGPGDSFFLQIVVVDNFFASCCSRHQFGNCCSTQLLRALFFRTTFFYKLLFLTTILQLVVPVNCKKLVVRVRVISIVNVVQMVHVVRWSVCYRLSRLAMLSRRSGLLGWSR